MYNQKYHKFDTLYNHKYGFHITGPRQDAFDAVLRVRPKIVKTLDFSVEVMKRIRQEIPDVFLIGRLFVHPQDFGQLSGGTAEAARKKGGEMAERILREEVNREVHHINGQPVFHAWESLNEVFPEGTDVSTHKLYEEYQVAFGEKMRAAGFEPIAFNFGQGNGNGAQWLELYPGTLETYNYLGFHEYDWPTMDRFHQIGLNGPVELQNRVSGGEGRGNDGMWRCLRYRRIMNNGIRQKFGDKHTCIITECGMTQGVWGGPSLDIGPWAKECTVPRDIPGGVVPTPIPVDDYWQSLLWYNNELMKDDYVMGACLFVTGAAGKPEWETFEHLGPIMDRLEAFQQVISSDFLTQTPTPPLASAITSAMPAVAMAASAPVVEPASFSSVSAATPIVEPAAQPAAALEKPASRWTYILSPGQGLPLLVGDVGVKNEAITLIKPDGTTERLTAGSKPEYGVGGFEIYANIPGSYKIQFMSQSFDIPLSGQQFTKVTFNQIADSGSVQVNLSFRDGRNSYAVGEKVFVTIQVTNVTSEPVPFGILGLVTSTGYFQTSWDNSLIRPGETFRHEDGLAFDAPGVYQLQLAICFARKDACLGTDEGWKRFEPGLEVVVQ
jgi:hypothetical protein